MEIWGHLLQHGLQYVAEKANEEAAKQAQPEVERRIKYATQLANAHLTRVTIIRPKSGPYGLIEGVLPFAKEGDPSDVKRFLSELCYGVVLHNREAFWRKCGDRACPCRQEISPRKFMAGRRMLRLVNELRYDHIRVFMLDYDPVQRDGRSQWILNVLGDSAKLYELNNRPSHHIYIHAQTEGHGRTWGAKKQFTIRSWDHDALDYAVREPAQYRGLQKVFGPPEESVRGDKVGTVSPGSAKTITFK